MAKTVGIDKKIMLFSFAPAAATVIAGILHLMMVPRSISDDLGQGILFLVGGILQVFWAVPVIKQWGRVWQIIGLVGTAVFLALWFGTHTHSLFGGGPGGHMPEGAPPGNIQQGGFQGNVTAEHFPRGPPPRGIASIPQVEFFQFAFIALYAALIKMSSKKKVQV